MSLIDLTSDVSSSRRGGSTSQQSDIYHTNREIDDFTTRGQNFQFNRGMFLTRAIFVATGSYHEQVRRSFTANVGGSAVNDLTRIVQQDEQADIISMSNVANRIIVPSSTIDRHVGIANGWAEPRCRFYLEFVKPVGSMNLIYCYTGYTDYAGVSENGSIDHAMPLHITNMMVISNAEGRGGNRTRSVRTDNTVVVSSRYYEDNSIRDRNGFGYQAPKDYLIDPRAAVLGAAYTRSTHQEDDWQYDAQPVFTPDHSTVGAYARNIERAHHIPAFYLTKLVNVTRATDSEGDLHDTSSSLLGYSEMDRTKRLNNFLRIDDFSENPLTNLLSEDTDIVSAAAFTWGDLIEYFPDAENDNILSIILPAGIRQTRGGSLEGRLRIAGEEDLDSDSWDGSTQETIIATMIAQQLPNLLLSELIESIRFTVTNETHSSLEERYQWLFGDHRRSSNDNRDAVVFLIPRLPSQIERQRLEAFRFKFEEVILAPITMNGLIDVSLMIDCDVQGSCKIVVSLGGGREYRFVAPTFAGSLTSSLLTSDLDHYNEFTNSVVNLVDEAVNA